MFINLSDSPFSTIDPRTGTPYTSNVSTSAAIPTLTTPPVVNTGWNKSKITNIPKPPNAIPGIWYTQDSAGNFVAQPKPAANAVVNDPEWGPTYAATGLPVNVSSPTVTSNTGLPVVSSSVGGNSLYNPNLSITQQKWFMPALLLGGAFIVYKMFKKRQVQ